MSRAFSFHAALIPAKFFCVNFCFGVKGVRTSLRAVIGRLRY
jgi:hypothetical protein